MRVTIIATGFESGKKNIPTETVKADPVAEIKEPTTTEAVAAKKPEKSSLTNTDFDDIMAILNRRR